MEERRDIFDVLLGRLDDADRVRTLAQIEANHAAQQREAMPGSEGRSRLAPGSGHSGVHSRCASGAQPGPVIRIFTSHRDHVTTVYVRDGAGFAATAFRTALDHGMHARQPLLVVDLHGVSFLDAAALDVLVDATAEATRRGKRIGVRRVNPGVYQGFVVAGLVAMLDINRASRNSYGDEEGKPHEHDRPEWSPSPRG